MLTFVAVGVDEVVVDDGIWVVEVDEGGISVIVVDDGGTSVVDVDEGGI
jgi:hypothetical protein